MDMAVVFLVATVMANIIWRLCLHHHCLYLCRLHKCFPLDCICRHCHFNRFNLLRIRSVNRH
jgi:hypothetical protein